MFSVVSAPLVMPFVGGLPAFRGVRGGRLLGEGDGELEGRALAHAFALHHYFPLVVLHYLLRDREPQSQPPVRRFAAGGLVKTLEKLREHLGVYALAGVLDGNADRILERGDVDGDLAAALGMADAVLKQVQEHLAYAALVGADHLEARGAFRRDLDV